MHTLIVIGLGLCSFGLCLFVGRFIGSDGDALGRAARVFVPLWFIGAVINMWIGVARAGHSLADEAPILLIVFGVPAAVARLLRWKLADLALELTCDVFAPGPASTIDSCEQTAMLPVNR